MPDGTPPTEGESRDANGRERAARLEQRLDRASEAAERLIAQAAEAALRRPPPAGWQQPAEEEDEQARPGAATEVDLLLEAIRAVRDRIPPDLQQRLAEAFRELLMALRALIDWYLERVERRASTPAEVQDIPIL
jgi:hypothetical protein